MRISNSLAGQLAVQLGIARQLAISKCWPYLTVQVFFTAIFTSLSLASQQRLVVFQKSFTQNQTQFNPPCLHSLRLILTFIVIHSKRVFTHSHVFAFHLHFWTLYGVECYLLCGMPNWNSALIPISTQNKNSTGVSALA